MESSQAPRDRRHGSRALLKRAQREQQSYKAEDGGGRPGVVVKRAEGESREADGEDRAPCWDVGPQPKAHELPAAVVFDPHEQPGGPKEPAPDLQVPAVMLAASAPAATLRLEGGCDGIEPPVRSLPVLAPHGGRHWPERCRF